jgi:hypothetical protein
MPPQAPPPPDTSLEDRMARFEANNMDRFDGPKPEKKVEPPKVEPKKEAPKQETPKEELPKQEQPKETPKEQPKVEAKEEVAPEKPKAKPWEMYHNTKKERDEIAKERDALKAEIEGLRKQQPQFDPQEHPEFKKMSERTKQLEEHIKFVDYTRSAEFKEKFQEPYFKSWAEAANKVKQFQIPNADGTVRAPSEAEFADLVSNGDDNQVADKLSEWFGANTLKAERVMKLRDQVREAGLAMERAKEEFATKGAEREKTLALERQRAEKEAQQKSLERADKFHRLMESGLNDERLAAYFKAPEDDPKAKELLTKGMQDADRAFGLGENPEEDEDTQISRHAAIRNRAGGWPMLKYLYDKSKSRVAELEKELADYKKSEPTDGSPAISGGAPAGDDLDSRLEKYRA